MLNEMEPHHYAFEGGQPVFYCFTHATRRVMQGERIHEGRALYERIMTKCKDCEKALTEERGKHAKDTG